MGIVFIILGFVIFGYVGRCIALSIFDLFFPAKKDDKYTFVDNSVHHHHHEYKNIHVIDDETYNSILNNKN